VSDTLTVHLSRDELHRIDVDDSFATRAGFEIEFVNHGRAVHVHVAFDDALAPALSVDDPNVFVESNDRTRVPVAAPDDVGDVRGSLTVVSGYGANERAVSVAVGPNAVQRTPGAAIGDSEPTVVTESDESEGGGLELAGVLPSREVAPVLALGAGALALAALAATVIDSAAVVVGVVAVILGVAVALGLLLQE